MFKMSTPTYINIRLNFLVSKNAGEDKNTLHASRILVPGTKIK